MLNWSQISGALDRIVLMGLTWFVSRGYITSADVQPIAEAAVAVAGALYAVYVNRNTNLVKQAASVPSTTVVTTPEIAKATPHLDNVASTTEVEVKTK